MSEIIDAHIHPGVDKSAVNWYDLVLDIPSQVETLKRAGVTKACGSVIKTIDGSSFNDIIELNNIALKMHDDYPDFYIPGISIHPHFVKESCKEIDRCCGEHGVRWIGELVGYFMGYANEYATEAAIEIMQHIQSYNAVVNIHCADLTVVENLCTKCPNLNIVLAHPGGSKTELLERAQCVAEHRNLHLDISGSGSERFGAIRKLIDIAGETKILFGSDFPINNPAGILHNLMLEPLSKTERNLLLKDNFLRLISL
jgi:predicted TIM-barrel fold metal-dependent hydrolase